MTLSDGESDMELPTPFVCTSPIRPPQAQIAHYHADCPRNFRGHHRRPREGESLTLALRNSDRITTREECIACEGEGGVFFGWILYDY